MDRLRLVESKLPPPEGSAGKDAQLLDKALEDRQVVMVPVVLTELLSDPKPLQALPKRSQTYLWLRSDPAIGNGRARCVRRSWQSTARRASPTP